MSESQVIEGMPGTGVARIVLGVLAGVALIAASAGIYAALEFVMDRFGSYPL